MLPLPGSSHRVCSNQPLSVSNLYPPLFPCFPTTLKNHCVTSQDDLEEIQVYHHYTVDPESGDVVPVCVRVTEVADPELASFSVDLVVNCEAAAGEGEEGIKVGGARLMIDRLGSGWLRGMALWRRQGLTRCWVHVRLEGPGAETASVCHAGSSDLTRSGDSYACALAGFPWKPARAPEVVGQHGGRRVQASEQDEQPAPHAHCPAAGRGWWQ